MKKSTWGWESSDKTDERGKEGVWVGHALFGWVVGGMLYLQTALRHRAYCWENALQQLRTGFNNLEN